MGIRKYPHIINHSFLSTGNDLKLSDNIVIKHPTAQDILNINDGIGSSGMYLNMINLLTCDPYDNMVMLDDLGKDYEKSDRFDVFICHWNNAIEEYKSNKEAYDKFRIKPTDNIKKALSFFLGEHNFCVCKISGEIDEDYAIVDADKINEDGCEYIFTRDMFNLMSEFLELMNVIDKSDRINPANESAKKVLIEDMRDEIKSRQRNNDTDDLTHQYDWLGNITISLCFGGNGGVSIFDVNKLPIYCIIRGFNITLKHENAGYIKSGIYSGTIDAKQLGSKDVDWIN